MQPYEFGYAVGTYTKRASWGDVGQVAGEIALGSGPALGLNQLDPTQRGLAQDIALYSNPFTGVATGVNDMARHLYNGRFGSALGAAGMTALSFLPGVGGAVGKTIGKGLSATGKAVGNQALRQGGVAAQKFVQAGGRAATQGQQAVTKGLQKIVPQQYGAITKAAPVRSTIDAAIRNPATTATIAGPMVLNGSGGAPHNAAAATAEALPATPAPQVPNLNRPMAPTAFRPQPIANF
jgi:hypothetical protein